MKLFTRCWQMSALVIILIMFLVNTSAEAKVVSTKQIQIVVSFTDPDLFLYRSNIGKFSVGAPDSTITSDLSITNPPGSTYIFKGGVFLGGTVDPGQASYTVDTRGMPLSGGNSIGTWICTGTRLIDWNLTGVNFPSEGTVIEEMNWSLLFKDPGGAAVNAVYTKGWFTAGKQFGVGKDFVVGKTRMAILGGSGLNAKINGDLTGESFLSPDGLASLLIVNLSSPIQIDVP